MKHALMYEKYVLTQRLQPTSQTSQIIQTVVEKKKP